MATTTGTPNRHRRYTRSWSLLTVLTFVGVVLHERAHEAICRWAGVKIHALRYFRLGTPAGYVQHERPDRYRTQVMITAAPLVLNACVSFCLFLGVVMYYHRYGVPSLGWPLPLETLIIGGGCWVAVSCALHAFPSEQDVENLWWETQHRFPRQLSVLLGLPIIGGLYILTRAEASWGDVAFTGGLAAGAWYVIEAGIPI
jgi:hypothetical protein